MAQLKLEYETSGGFRTAGVSEMNVAPPSPLNLAAPPSYTSLPILLRRTVRRPCQTAGPAPHVPCGVSRTHPARAAATSLSGRSAGNPARCAAFTGRSSPRFLLSVWRLPQRLAEPPAVPYKTVSRIGFNYCVSIPRANSLRKNILCHKPLQHNPLRETGANGCFSAPVDQTKIVPKWGDKLSQNEILPRMVLVSSGRSPCAQSLIAG